MKIKITAMCKTEYADLQEKYETPLENPCNMRVGDSFVIEQCECPKNFCTSAWNTLLPFIKDLFDGKGNFFDGWMKNEKSAMLSCNDGFRPVSFYIEVIE